MHVWLCVRGVEWVRWSCDLPDRLDSRVVGVKAGDGERVVECIRSRSSAAASSP